MRGPRVSRPDVQSARPVPERQQVIEALQRVLNSPTFQGSRRCRDLLQYLVMKQLEGDTSALKERVIGAELFGRTIDYDTSNDAIVRVKANEVRRRLSAYYGEAGREESLRIEIPVGSYIPVFRWSRTEDRGASRGGSEQVSSAVPAAASWLAMPSWRWNWAAAIITVVAAAWISMRPTRDVLKDFWAPFYGSKEPVLLCIPARDRWFFDQEVRRALLKAAQAPTPRLDLALQPGSIAAVANGEMSLQNFRAILQLAMHMARHRVPMEVRLVNEVSEDVIRRRHVILLGAYHNPWAMELSSGMRYVFESEGEGHEESTWIRDRQEKTDPRWKVPRLWPYATQNVDYAIISRTIHTETGQVVVSLAGLNGFGTQAGAEFLTTSTYWKNFSRLSPPGWQRRNCQVVLETKVVRDLPNPPKILAVHVW